jgi:hypothetical protein
MKAEHPILFSTEMVKAILDGRKTQTRRVIKLDGWSYGDPLYETSNIGLVEIEKMCPYGKVGDHLWVRETFDSDCTCGNTDCNGVIYKAGFSGVLEPKWRPSIFMPHKFSRITLEITDIRVQRLQEITQEDAFLEGMNRQIATSLGLASPESEETFNFTYCRRTFSKLWDSINGKPHNRLFTLDDKSNRHYVKDQIGEYAWESNPWVWAITFKKLER